MKKLNKIFATVFASLVLILGLSACEKANPDFSHDNNLLSTVNIKTTPGAEGIPGQISEYNAAGQLVPADQVTVKSVEGGYGIVLFELDPSLRGVYDPERCYLGASLTFDEIIRPGLGGIKNICNRNSEGVAQGIDITVTSGIGTVRPYKIIGYFEGELKLTSEE